jgi:hypothetical protein
MGDRFGSNVMTGAEIEQDILAGIVFNHSKPRSIHASELQYLDMLPNMASTRANVNRWGGPGVINRQGLPYAITGYR